MKLDTLSRGTIALLHIFIANVNNLLDQARVTLQVMTNTEHELSLDVLHEDSDDSVTSECSDDEF